MNLSDLAKAHPGAALSASAALLYTYTWIPYNSFYWQLGTTPAEVGVDYIAVLERAIGLLFTVPIVVFLVAWLISIILKPIAEIKGHYPSWASLGNLAPWMIGAALVAIFCMNLWKANQLVDAVKSGESVNVGPYAGWLPTTVSHLWIKATRSTVSQGAHTPSQTLTYLGASSGTAVFYDHMAKAIVRMPSNSVVIKSAVDAEISAPADVARPE